MNDWLSIGGGAQILYGRLNSKTSVRNLFGGNDGQIQLKSDNVGAGGIAGVLIEPVEGTRFGVTYNSPVKLDFKQKPDLSGGGAVFNALDPRISNARIDLGLTVPQQVMLSGYHDLTDTIAIMGNVVWQQWSQFGEPRASERRRCRSISKSVSAPVYSMRSTTAPPSAPPTSI